jgi:glycosyltransferase involved in cell wall biosynthesis
VSNTHHKKIVIVGPAYPLRGGIANFNEALALSLHKEGHFVNIFSFYFQYPNFLFPGKTQYATTEPKPEGLTIHDSISSVNPISWSKTARLIQAESPDIVLIRFWLPFMGPALGSIAKKLRKKGVRVIGITDNVIPHEKRAGDKVLTKYFVKNCDGFVTLSESVLHDISQFTDNPNKIKLAHPLYDTFGPKASKEDALLRLKMEANQKYLLFFGLIREYKGLDIAIAAMADAKVRDIGVKLIVAGEFYDKKEKYLEQIHQLKLEDSIIILDKYIPTEDVKDYFAVSDAVIQPYKTATQSGITQVAYHFDKPMIVSNVGGLPEIVPHGRIGLVVEPKPEAMSNAIVQIYQNGNLAKFEANMPVEKKKFEWSYFVEQLLQFAATIP